MKKFFTRSSIAVGVAASMIMSTVTFAQDVPTGMTFIAKACQAKLAADLGGLRGDVAKNQLDKESQDALQSLLKDIEDDILSVDDETECDAIGQDIREARLEVAAELKEMLDAKADAQASRKAIKKTKKCCKKRSKKGKGKKLAQRSILPTCELGSGLTQDAPGGLCAVQCPKEMLSTGVECVAKLCPPNFSDDGLYCGKKISYSLGAGYPWKLGEPTNDKKQFERCENDHGAGNCEKVLAIVYPKCKSGFTKRGLECSQTCPTSTFNDHKDKPHGWTDIGVSCKKPAYAKGVGVAPNHCPKGSKFVAGACYW